MIKYVIRRIIAAIPVLFGITLVSFALVRAIPGGPFDFSGTKTMPAAVRENLERRYGLNQPFLLNLPNDGFAPDAGDDLPISRSYAALPDCDALRSGVDPAQARPSGPVVDTESGWYLLRMSIERNETQLTVNGRTLRCLQVTPVLYSDLFRSQFFSYLFNALRLDLGISLGKATRGTPVNALIADRLPVSALLGLMSVVVGFLFGIPLGVLAALYRNSIADYSVTTFAGLLAAIPTLALGPFLITVFVVQLKWLPNPDPRVWKNPQIFSWDFIGVALLPVMTFGIGIAAGLARLTRASLLQVLRDDYIRTARAKGLRERLVIYIHALKNALIPVATIIGPLLAGVVTGSLIIERIFAIPGLGEVFVSGIAARDYNLLVGVTLLYSVFLIAGNILVDVMYTWLDPRIRFD
jgi:oligopeptide transport system permease protein